GRRRPPSARLRLMGRVGDLGDPLGRQAEHPAGVADGEAGRDEPVHGQGGRAVRALFGLPGRPPRGECTPLSSATLIAHHPPDRRAPTGYTVLTSPSPSVTFPWANVGTR